MVLQIYQNTISHDKMLHYIFLIDITVNYNNLPRSLKGVYVHTYSNVSCPLDYL